MKFCRFEWDGFAHYGRIELRNSTAPDMPDGEPWIEEILSTAPIPEEVRFALHRQQQAETAQRLFKAIPVAEAKLLTPVQPTKIICVGRNYRDHAQELGNEVPTEPLLFFKPVSSLLAPGGVVLRPAVSARVDFEGELTIVIGQRVHKLSSDADWRRVVLGYTLANDVTARDLQNKDDQWARAKGFDTFCPLGPWVANDLDPVSGVTLETRVNGELRQQGTTRDFIFSIPELLVYITSVMTLEPGDLILTGTPAGVGPLSVGDRVEISIPGLGVLANFVADE